MCVSVFALWILLSYMFMYCVLVLNIYVLFMFCVIIDRSIFYKTI